MKMSYKNSAHKERSVRFGNKVSVRRCLDLSSPSQWIRDHTEKLKGDDSPTSEDSGFFEPTFMENDCQELLVQRRLLEDDSHEPILSQVCIHTGSLSCL